MTRLVLLLALLGCLGLPLPVSARPAPGPHSILAVMLGQPKHNLEKQGKEPVTKANADSSNTPIQITSTGASQEKRGVQLIQMGDSVVEVGPDPEIYVQKEDVFTTNYWIRSIQVTLEQLYFVITKHQIHTIVTKAIQNYTEDETFDSQTMDLFINELAEGKSIQDSAAFMKTSARDKSVEDINISPETNAQDGRHSKIISKSSDGVGKVLTRESNDEQKTRTSEIKDIFDDLMDRFDDIQDVIVEKTKTIKKIVEEIRGKDWTTDELEWIFWTLHQLIKDDAIEIDGGKLIINGNEYPLWKLIQLCCPIGK